MMQGEMNRVSSIDSLFSRIILASFSTYKHTLIRNSSVLLENDATVIHLKRCMIRGKRGDDSNLSHAKFHGNVLMICDYCR